MAPCESLYSQWVAAYEDWAAAYNEATAMALESSVAAADALDACQDGKISCPLRIGTWLSMLNRAQALAERAREKQEVADSIANALWACIEEHSWTDVSPPEGSTADAGEVDDLDFEIVLEDIKITVGERDEEEDD